MLKTNPQFISTFKSSEILDTLGTLIMEHLEDVVNIQINFSEIYDLVSYVKDVNTKLFVVDSIISSGPARREEMFDLLDVYKLYGITQYVAEVLTKIVKRMDYSSIQEYADYLDVNSRKFYTSLKNYNRENRDFLTSRYFRVEIRPEIGATMFTCPFTGVQNTAISYLAFNRQSIMIRLQNDRDYYTVRLSNTPSTWSKASYAEKEYFENTGYVSVELPNFETEDGKVAAIVKYSRK